MYAQSTQRASHRSSKSSFAKRMDKIVVGALQCAAMPRKTLPPLRPLTIFISCQCRNQEAECGLQAFKNANALAVFGPGESKPAAYTQSASQTIKHSLTSKPRHRAACVASRQRKQHFIRVSETFVLIHGSWHAGWASDAVIRQLAEKGHRGHAPTLAGHGPNATRLGITHGDCVDAVVTHFHQYELSDVILVGHSFGGSVIQKVVEQFPDRVKRLVFLDAFVLEDNQCVFDNLPSGYIAPI